MKMFTIAGACLLLAAGVQAQEPQDQASREKVEVRTAQGMGGMRVPFERNVKGAPYSADTLTEATQALADGNRIARKTTGRVYRDGEGRVRREEDRQDGTVGISIVDPVANVSYRLDPQQHVAWKTAGDVGYAVMEKTRQDANQVEQRRRVETEARGRGEGAGSGAGLGAGAGALEPPRGEAGAAMMRGGTMFRYEPGPVEKKVIDGISVEGHKSTTTIPAGQIGNDLPITIASEEWSSPDLKILVYTRFSDPRMGESTYKLTNIVRAEPDPSLFQVPAGYTIRETGIRRNDQPQ